MRIVISGTYGLNDLKADLQSMHNEAGVKDEGVMFLFTDGQITNEKFVVFINDLLTSGEIAELYANEDKDAILQRRSQWGQKLLVNRFPGKFVNFLYLPDPRELASLPLGAACGIGRVSSPRWATAR